MHCLLCARGIHWKASDRYTNKAKVHLKTELFCDSLFLFSCRRSQEISKISTFVYEVEALKKAASSSGSSMSTRTLKSTRPGCPSTSFVDVDTENWFVMLF
ncbi:hypothetical protein AVEN_182531-1 [Araneus ventricosus]|uniref:Uncharacterized protein n=1 Tax=Araneus ventricosus TaxID=182803 RepID=A0A4Y2BYH1_ARAVE|nr:hypothetical protein AVEN_182531-1 [Araneus ventricosus]